VGRGNSGHVRLWHRDLEAHVLRVSSRARKRLARQTAVRLGEQREWPVAVTLGTWALAGWKAVASVSGGMQIALLPGSRYVTLDGDSERAAWHQQSTFPIRSLRFTSSPSFLGCEVKLQDDRSGLGGEGPICFCAPGTRTPITSPAFTNCSAKPKARSSWNASAWIDWCAALGAHCPPEAGERQHGKENASDPGCALRI
jgi:hypothetical protein